jgi:hypothetical protein
MRAGAHAFAVDFGYGSDSLSTWRRRSTDLASSQR